MLATCPDFRLEKKERAESEMEKQGHMLTPSVKGRSLTPNSLTLGVEYAWGFVNRYNRKRKDRIATHQLANVTASSI